MRALVCFAFMVVASLAGCSTETSAPPSDAAAADDGSEDASPDAQPQADVDGAGSDDTADSGPEPTLNHEAAARAFRLYYKERVDRALIAFNRYALFGDVTAASVINGVAVAREGDAYELVPGPTDNNLIGTSAWGAWHAWKHLRTRALELTLVRMFDGLAFFEAVSGHPGLTAREVYPGWTRVVDGKARTTTRTRFGVPIAPGELPEAPSAALEGEIIEAFFDGGVWTYRENPSEFIWSFMPAYRVGKYCVENAWSPSREQIIVSQCCSSLMQTPAEHPWQGAFWGNHNSRDNFPDLALGILAALEAQDHPDLPPEVRAAAERAVAAGKRIGDLIQSSGGNIMTVDEHHDYGTLTVSGTVRPHGEPEAQDLGSMSACPMAYLGRAIATEGLSAPLPQLPLPGSLEKELTTDPQWALFEIECEAEPLVEGIRHCTDFAEAYCGLRWDNFDQLRILDQPWFELLAELDAANPGTAEQVLGGFQNDFDDVAEAQVALVAYFRITGQAELEAAAREALGDLTALMRTMADMAWAGQPDKHASQRYESAIFDASAGLPVDVDALADLAVEEARVAALEDLIEIDETSTAPIKTPEQLQEEAKERLKKAWPSVEEKYLAAFSDAPPVRVNAAGDGYEARDAHVDEWWPVEVPRHRGIGGLKLFQAIPICTSRPEVLDCTWAALGCEAADVDGDGGVDSEDAAAVAAGLGQSGCSGEGADAWCGGLDADRSGTVDETDQSFVTAAEGCWY